MDPQSRHVKDFRRRMLEALSSEAECQEFFEALEELGQNPARGVRVNPLREGAQEYLASISKELTAVSWEPRGFYAKDTHQLARDPGIGAGLYYIQEPGAMEAVPMLDPQPGELCLDLCAAPGGKSTQIAERLQGKGWLVSNETVRARAAKLDALLARHGATNVTVLSLDPARVAQLYSERFDAILVDAPCSGESLFAKRQEKRSDIRDAEVQGCARRQLRILEDAATALKPGGRIVYSTCTYSLEENEKVVRALLSRVPRMKLVREARRWPHRDRVAGGYAALLVSEAFRETSEALFETEADGLIRHGTRLWNDDQDLYAAAMAALTPGESGFTDLEVDAVAAAKFLRGESLPLPAGQPGGPWFRIVWRGWPLGPAKRAEGRVNNWVPKILRTN